MSSAASISDKIMTWLIVGGAPRSGTTALGEAFSKSSQIAILHEYPSFSFFAALNKFFDEEERQAQYPGFELYGHLIPRGELHGPGMVRGIFSQIFPDKPDVRIAGTKTPSYELMPACKYPQWIVEKTIHITRNPYDVMLSALKKNHPESFKAGSSFDTLSFKRELHLWVSAWNHAVERVGDENFLHLFHDDLIASPEQEKQRVSSFLDGVDDFDFLAFRATQQNDATDRFRNAGFEKFLPIIEAIVPYETWIEQAKQDYASRKTYKTTMPILDRVRNALSRNINGLHKRLCSC